MVTNGILLHVYHLETKEWDNLTWGYPSSDRFGTVTQFAYTLLSIPVDQQVGSIIFSGPSVKNGLNEGEYTKQFLLERINDLNDFPSLKARISKLSSNDYDVFVQRIQELTIGPVMKNTLGEVSQAAKFFNENHAVAKVFQIAASSHAPRCLQNQLVSRRMGSIPPHQPWYVVASDVGFSDTKPEDVVILEPPHRGDDPMVNYVPTLADAIKPYFAMDVKDKQQLIQTVKNTVSRNEG